MKLSNRLLPLGVLLLVPAFSACRTERASAELPVDKFVPASIENRPGERTVRVVTRPMEGPAEGLMMMTVQPFVDRNGNLELDEGEAIGQAQRVGNGKSASRQLETIDFAVPQVDGDDLAMLWIELSREASRMTMTAWHDSQTDIWKRRIGSWMQMDTTRGTLTSR